MTMIAAEPVKLNSESMTRTSLAQLETKTPEPSMRSNAPVRSNMMTALVG